MYLKITNKKEIHHNLQYRDGLIEDPVPFEREGSCIPGGIYFTTPEFVCNFLHFGPWIREVTIPEDAEMVMDPDGNKWRASKVILSPRKDLREVEVWKWLVECGVVIQNIALKYLIKNGNLEVIKYLVGKGIDIHDENDYAIRTAVYYGYLDIVKYLIECGIDIHIGNDTPLKYAAYNGHLDIVKYLVESGVDIHVENDYALRSAASFGHLDIVEYLIEKGADIHADNDYALRRAKRNGHTETVEYLESCI